MISSYHIRERQEKREEALSPYASRSRLSRGRVRPEEPDPVRTAYQRDRDRIIHSKAFRRLKHKTQVFIAPAGDHYVTRLTHTLEVTQIARTVARALNLNEDLAEAIGLGHDLGHTPFGHLGESTLAELSPEGFRHNQHSLRVVDYLEKEGEGLNLTWEVRMGILAHSKPRETILVETDDEGGLPLEAKIVRLADAIAYINHDLGDAIRAQLLSERDLPPGITSALGSTTSQRINTLVTDMIEASWSATGQGPPVTGEVPAIRLGLPVEEAANALREFLFQRIYIPLGENEEAQAARHVLRALHAHYRQHPEKVPDEFRMHSATPERAALDFIAGMTDLYALRLAEALSPGISSPFTQRLQW